MKVSGRYIRDWSMLSLQKSFENGWIPKKSAKYDCWDGCEGVKRAFKERQCSLDDFGVENK